MAGFSKRIIQNSDGKAYRADDSPLCKERSASGNTIFCDNYGFLYDTNGVFLGTKNETIDHLEEIRQTNSSYLSTIPLIKKGKKIFTNDGTKIVPAKVKTNGQLELKGGKQLTAFKTSSGATLFDDSTTGILYSKNGTPIATICKNFLQTETINVQKGTNKEKIITNQAQKQVCYYNNNNKNKAINKETVTIGNNIKKYNKHIAREDSTEESTTKKRNSLEPNCQTYKSTINTVITSNQDRNKIVLFEENLVFLPAELEEQEESFEIDKRRHKNINTPEKISIKVPQEIVLPLAVPEKQEESFKNKRKHKNRNTREETSIKKAGNIVLPVSPLAVPKKQKESFKNKRRDKNKSTLEKTSTQDQEHTSEKHQNTGCCSCLQSKCCRKTDASKVSVYRKKTCPGDCSSYNLAHENNHEEDQDNQKTKVQHISKIHQVQKDQKVDQNLKLNDQLLEDNLQLSDQDLSSIQVNNTKNSNQNHMTEASSRVQTSIDQKENDNYNHIDYLKNANKTSKNQDPKISRNERNIQQNFDQTNQKASQTESFTKLSNQQIGNKTKDFQILFNRKYTVNDAINIQEQQNICIKNAAVQTYFDICIQSKSKELEQENKKSNKEEKYTEKFDQNSVINLNSILAEHNDQQKEVSIEEFQVLYDRSSSIAKENHTREEENNKKQNQKKKNTETNDQLVEDNDQLKDISKPTEEFQILFDRSSSTAKHKKEENKSLLEETIKINKNIEEGVSKPQFEAKCASVQTAGLLTSDCTQQQNVSPIVMYRHFFQTPCWSSYCHTAALVHPQINRVRHESTNEQSNGMYCTNFENPYVCVCPHKSTYSRDYVEPKAGISPKAALSNVSPK